MYLHNNSRSYYYLHFQDEYIAFVCDQGLLTVVSAKAIYQP